MSGSLGDRAIDDILNGIVGRSRAYLARAITMVEDEAQGAAVLLSGAYRIRKGAFITGITGAPGVGKSTLVDALIGALRALERRVGVIAVDPSSPFTGGAILGDRVRLRASHGLDPDVFFRSLASRGHLGGVSRHTGDVIALMDAFGFDDIVVETVGAGQSEVDIMKYAHTVIVVLSPGMGDEVQALKAGIMEIGDIFCVNKADLPGADKTRRETEMMLSMKEKEDGGWTPLVLKTVAVSPDQGGVLALRDAVRSHQEYLMVSDLLRQKNRESHRAVLEEYLKLLTVESILKDAERDSSLNGVLEDLSGGAMGPLEGARLLVKRHLGSPGNGGAPSGCL